MAFQSVGGEEGGEKRVHQIFQRRGSRDIDFREKESSGIPGCEDEICTSHAATSRIFTLRPALLPPFPPLHSFPLPFHPFSHCPEEKRKRLRSFASGPQLRSPIISTCLLLPRRNAYKAKQTIHSTLLLLLLLQCVQRLRSPRATSRRRVKNKSGTIAQVVNS